MTEATLEEEKKELTRQYKELLRMSYRTLTPKEKKLSKRSGLGGKSEG